MNMKPYYVIRNTGKVAGKPFDVGVFDGVCAYSLGKAFATKAEAVKAVQDDGKGFPLRYSLADNRPQN